MPQKVPNIEHYPERSKQFRIRFNIDNKLKSFGYYSSFDEALMLRNLVATRLGLPTVYEEHFGDLEDDETWNRYESISDRVSENHADLLEMAEELGEHRNLVANKPKTRVPTWKLQEDLNALALRFTRLEDVLRELKANL